MKRLACILFFLQFCCHMYAEEPVISNHNNRGVKFKYGLEWGMSGNILNYNISTFITDVQSLVQLKSVDPFFHINGEIKAFAGLDVGNRLNVFIAAGYAGIQKNLRFFPIELNGEFFIKPFHFKGGYFHVGGGWGFCENPNHRNALYGRGGYGYRIDIGNGLAMDTKSCLQVSFSHPDVNDKYTGKTVPIANLRQSNSISLNTIISVALIF